MKKTMGPLNCLYPMPVTLVGANVSGKPNYLAVAHVGIMNHGKPQYISVGLSRRHYTNEGIRENGTFSVNIPAEEMVVATDYCGIASGRNADKSALFETFYGELKTAPMISECPVNMECLLYDTIEFPTHEVFIGEIRGTYCDEAVLSNDEVDPVKLKPMLFEMGTKRYWRLGDPIAKCWNIGKTMKGK